MAQQEAWNNTYESSPNLGTEGYQLAGAITSTRYNTRRVVGKEHTFQIPEEGGTYDMQGVHKAGSAVAYTGTNAPLVRPDGTALDSNDKGRLWVDETNGISILKYYKGPTDGWMPMSTDLTGMIAFFPRIQPPPAYNGDYIAWGWLLCDGKKIATTGDADYVDPRLAPLVKYLANSPTATEARLPRMTFTSGGASGLDGRYIRCAGTEDGALERPDGWDHYTPKWVDANVGQHTHTTQANAGKITWNKNEVFYTTLSYSELSSEQKEAKRYAGQHSHTISEGSAGSGGLFRFKPAGPSSRTGYESQPRHLYSDSTPYVPGGDQWDDPKTDHQHIIKVDIDGDFVHSHTIENNGSDSDNRPLSIYLFPFIHI